jgi:hypothetical protein
LPRLLLPGRDVLEELHRELHQLFRLPRLGFLHRVLPARGDKHQAAFSVAGRLRWLSACESQIHRDTRVYVSNPLARSWLFDLQSDPNEQRDLSAEHPEKLAEL